MSGRALLEERLGPFRVERLLGEGAMSEVYAAVDERLRRRVALKVLRPHLARSRDVRRRFASESRLASQLDHPNIVTIYDADEMDGFLYISMRLVEGPDLGALIESRGVLSPTRSARIIKQAAAALDAAHEAGLVHRDVKPANILATRTERGTDHIFLTDFGLTRSIASASRHTQTGEIVGSVHYMSPEQIEGREVTRLSDVYSLGCVLYECLTGKVPFERDSDLAVLWAHVNVGPPALTDLVPLPRSLDPVVERALAKDPRDRYQSCGELSTALRRALTRRHLPPPRATVLPVRQDGQEPARKAPPDARRRRLGSFAGFARSVTTATLALSLVGSVVLGAMRLTDRSEAEPPSSGSGSRSATEVSGSSRRAAPRPSERSRERRTARRERRESRAADPRRDPVQAAGATSGLSRGLPGAASDPVDSVGAVALVERTVTRHYDAPTFDGYARDCVTDNVGCVEFTAESGERFVSISISDSSGQPVFAWIKKDLDADGDADGEWVDICDRTEEPVRVSPGAIVRVLLQTGDCRGRQSTPTSGTVTALFSNLGAAS